MRYLVIDANIAKACKDPAESVSATQSYAFLMAVREKHTDLGVVLNDALYEEWEKHGNRTFASWWANMESRSRVRHVGVKQFRDYRRAVQDVEDEGVRNAMIKDWHLIELALEGWHPIASMDEKQRRYVRDLSSTYSLIAAIQWCNPILDPGWGNWVDGGCEVGIFRVDAAAA
ncbi:hypothetical protein [Clavibacter zhangzhiyongii]|uniref:hypothetical protein n=1 Tax=Clavibacter zhangzhiyongii TaxID=2768071 RepID=UPI0039DFA75A